MFSSEYGVARHIYIPIVKRGVVDFAVSADWTPAAGDVKISKDGGAAANVTNLPTAITMGNTAIWDFSITATELQAAQVVVTVADSATKAVEDQSFGIETYVDGSFRGAVTGATTTTTLIDSALTQSGTDHWKGRIVIFTSGALKYQASDITAFDPATDKITFTAMTAAASAGDTYLIV